VAQICLSLTGRSIAENLSVLELYRGKVDLVELRADHLEASEMLHLRSFPERAGLPCILAVRRRKDGGSFEAGEGVRLVMMAKGLTHARMESEANFAYVELESDFHVPAIEEACRIFGTRIIRSYHDFEGSGIDRLDELWSEVAEEADEIPKLALACRGARDFATLLEWSRRLPDRDRILVGMGPYGFPSRVLANKTGSLLVYTSALAAGLPSAAPGHTDPSTLLDTYRFREIGPASEVYALGGGTAVTASLSPQLHNAAFSRAGLDAVFVPFPAEDAASFLASAEAAGAKGAAVTVPHKEGILPYLSSVSDEVASVGACNTILREEGGWRGFNTDVTGFELDILDFLGRKDLFGLRATVIGAGGAARAVLSVLSRLGAGALILNRTLAKARALAKTFDFTWAANDERAQQLVAEKYSDLIVNATSLGMEDGSPAEPFDWYEYQGHEAVYDIVYRPAETAFRRRAMAAGCRTRNGWGMLRHQSAAQFRIWTGREPPSSYLE